MLQDTDEDSISIKRAVSRNAKESTTPKHKNQLGKFLYWMRVVFT